MSSFTKELESLINRHSLENGSNTPDFILAQYLNQSLETFNTIMEVRDQWYGINPPSTELVGAPVIISDSDTAHSGDIVKDLEIERKVIDAMSRDLNYPLGDPDARNWAIAWRIIRDKNKINANGSQEETDIDGWMTTWFANAMASSPDNFKPKTDVEGSALECAL